MSKQYFLEFMLRILLIFLAIFINLTSASNDYEIKPETFNDFKTLMMYFNEPLLAQATIRDYAIAPNTKKGASFEGAYNDIMAKKLADIIESKKCEVDDDVKLFGQNLENGRKVVESIIFIGKNKIENDAKALQEKLLDMLYASKSSKKTIILPFAWKGTLPHAITLIIEENDNTGSSCTDKTYNLIVANAGDGLEYHYTTKDPNGIYPELKHFWIRFENIKEKDIFADNYWFMYALISLNNHELAQEIEIISGNAKHYFYGTILNNFSKYIDVDKNETRLLPYQRSGSCSLSSLMAALLYFSKDLSKFHENRVIIGHEMLNQFLDTYKTDKDFKKLISDGFDLISRKLMHSTSTALANQILLFLETKFPNSFLHAGLVGSRRSKWIKENKAAAIKVLNDNPDVRKLVETSVNLGLMIEDFLKKSPINVEQTKIEIHEGIKAIDYVKYNKSPSKTWTKHSAKNVLDLLTLSPFRRKEIYNDFSEIKHKLNNCKSFAEFRMLICVRDVFEQSKDKKWWNYLKDPKLQQNEISEFSDICKDILKYYISIDRVPSSLDDLVTLVHLQIAVWQSAVVYDSKITTSFNLNLQKFKPPSVLEEVIGQIGTSLTSTSFLNWPIKTNFDSENLNKLNFLLKEYKSLTSGTEEFFGPSKFLKNDDGSCKTQDVYNSIMSTVNNKILYETMWKEFEARYKITRQNKFDEKKEDRVWLDAGHVTLTIFLTDFPNVILIFPHYVKLMESMMFIYKRIAKSPIIRLHNSDYFDQNLADHSKVGLQFFTKQNVFNFYGVDNLDHISRCNLIKTNLTDDFFFALRHSQAQTELENIMGFESWLNYVKGAQDATIFDSENFMYLSDHLLNFPKLLLDDRGEIVVETNKLYPSGFDAKHIKEIYQSLMKLIKINLDSLIVKGSQMKADVKMKILSRAVNMTVPLVKFISRIDNDELISGDNAANMLAEIYTLFYNFSLLKNDYNVDEKQISQVNLLMGQICDVKIRNPKKFLLLIKDTFPQNPSLKSRKTLSRIHWFVARIYYSYTSLGRSHSDDLFMVGQIFHPYVYDEIDSMNVILKSVFASKYTQDPKNVSIEYDEKGDIVLLKILERANQNIGIQLSSGKVVENGFELIERSKVINHETFKKYFSDQNDQKIAARGDITKIGATIIYVVSNFKFEGNTIAILCEPSKSPTTLECQVYRKNKKQQYLLWLEDKNYYIDTVKYKWIHGYKLYQNEVENQVILLKDDDVEPLNIIDFNNCGTVSIKISDFFDTRPFNLLNYDPEKHKDLDRHVKYFTNTDTLLAKTNDDALVVIYPGLRFYDSPKHPIVLVEMNITNTNRDYIFEVKNIPGLRIESKQIVIHKIGIKGTLVATNDDGQKFILAPMSDKRGSEENLRFVERIPIVGDLPAPQTRLQRLLMAFYCINSRELGFAREMLHPFTSINHNEPFSTKEIEIIHWIVKIGDGGPEVASLKLMAYMHAFNNSQKFPTEYIKAKDQDNTEEGKIKTFRSKIIPEIKNEIGKSVPIYFNSIRDLPEKYYLHRIFPEYISNENTEIIAKYLINSVKTMPDERDNVSIFVWDVSQKKPCDSLAFNLGRVCSRTLTNILLCLREDGPNLDEYLKLMAKLVHKSEKNNVKSTLSQNEAVLICAALDKNSFSKSAEDLKKYFEEEEVYSNIPYHIKLKAGFKFDRKYCKTSIEQELSEIVRKCKKNYLYKNIFSRYDATKGSTFTRIQDIFDNFKADSKKIYEGLTGLPEDFKFEPVEKNDLKEFKKIINDVNSVLNPEKDPINIGFSDENVKKSTVLQKLKGSIETFVKEKGQYSITEIQIDKNLSFMIKLNSFKVYLEKRIDEFNIKSKELVSNLTTKLERNDCSNTIEAVTRLMHQRKIKSFEKLYSCYQRLSVQCIQNKFPQFDEKTCTDLLKESMMYYSMHVLIEFMIAVRGFVEGFVANKTVSIDDLILFLDEAGKIMDFNSRLRTPSILNFEYRSKKYRLRAEQVKDIDDLTSIDPKTGLFKSAVIQRMMAAGKTLILGTISVVLKALGNTKLSILVPPASLYQSNLSAMQARTYNFFKTKGHNFIFPRLEFGDLDDIKNVVIPFLKFILQKIESVKMASDYYVLSPDTLQAFLNSYIEIINYFTIMMNDSNSLDSTVTEALKLYANIYNIFRTEGSIILDEIDMTMDPKKELNFPTVENEPLNMVAATLMTDLIEFSIFDKEIIKLGLDILGNNQSGLTAENYEKYRDILFKYISEQLEIATSLWSENLLDSEVKELNIKDIMSFLKTEDIEFMYDWMERIQKADKIIVGNALIIIKVQLWKYLKDAMKSTANLNFGATGPNRPDAEYAIPYLAANTPSPSSEFSDRWETLNKTLLMLASVNCSERIAKKMIGYVRSRIVEETSLKVKMKGTATYKNIVALIPGINPMDLDDKNQIDVQTIHKALKTRSPAAIRLLFSYALDEIFSQMKFPVEQITSNALNMTSMFGSVQGYSGTIDNVNILPREVVDGAYTNHIENEKNNGGISLKLIKDSREVSGKNKAVYQIPDEILKKDVKIIVNNMFEYGLPNKSAKNELSALIDTGAFFKNSKNKEVAEAILEISYPRISVVLYYDEDSNQVEFIKKTTSGSIEIGFLSNTDPDTIFKTTQTKIENRFTFYDQRHITGSDILQPKTARALMTIGTRVLLRDILQGTLRMRQFMTSQKVHLITSSSAANFYFSKAGVRKAHVEVSDMITLGAFNEDDKQLVENEKLAFTKIDNEVRRFVLDEITRAILESNNFSEIITLWFQPSQNCSKNIRDLFIRLIKENPIGWMIKSVKKDKSEVLKAYTEYWTTKIEETAKLIVHHDDKFDIKDSSTKSGKNFSILMEAFKDMTTIVKDDKDPKTKHLLPGVLKPEINERVFEQDGGGEVEMQVFTQNLAEIDIDKLISKTTSSPKNHNRESFDLTPLVKNVDKEEFEYNYLPYSAENLRTVLFNYWFSGDHLKMASSALITTGNRLAVSKDLIKIINSERPFEIFSRYTWEGSHILIQVLPEKKGSRAVLLSTESAIETRDVLFSAGTNFNGSTFWLCDLSGSVSATNDTKTTIYMNVLEFLPSSRVLFFDLLVFNGSLNHILTNKHMKKIYYTKWLKSENYKYRALFLLLRMRVLANKSKYIMADNSIDMTILNRAARGDKEILNGVKMAAGAFKKAPIAKEVEEAYFTSTGNSRPVYGSSGVKLNDSFDMIYTAITNLSVPVPSSANDLRVIKITSTTIKVDAERDNASKTNDKVDFFEEGDSLSKMVKEWLDVCENKKDVNNFVADPKKIRIRPKLPIDYDPNTNNGGSDGTDDNSNRDSDSDSDSDDESEDDKNGSSQKKSNKRPVTRNNSNAFEKRNRINSSDSGITEVYSYLGIGILIIAIIGVVGLAYNYMTTNKKNVQVNPEQEEATKHDDNEQGYQQSYKNYQGYTQNDNQNNYQDSEIYQQPYPNSYQQDYPNSYQQDYQRSYQQDDQGSYQHPYPQNYQSDYEQNDSPNPNDTEETTSTESSINRTVHKDPENFKN